jgi:hypothetical protein
MRRLAVILGAAILATGAVRAGSIEVDFNPKAEFERYKTWAWAPGRDQQRHGVLVDATMRERVEQALAGRLKNAGLQPAGPNENPDVLVRYEGDLGTGKTRTMTEGYLYDGIAPAYTTVQFQEQAVTLIVDLIDSSTSTLAWRLYLNQKFGVPNEPPDKLQRALDKGFAKYPPSASARAKKAREMEKASRAK